MTLKPRLLPGQRATPESAVLPSTGAGLLSTRDDLGDWFEISPQALLQCDVAGRILRANAPMLALIGTEAPNLAMVPAPLRQLLRWPDGLPPAGQTLRHEAWLALEGRGTRHLRATVRGSSGVGARRWLVQLEDLALEDQRELAQAEIAALMGKTGIGVATYDPSRGWVTAAGPADGGDAIHPARAGADGVAGASGAVAAQMSISREIVEPESLPEYERLQRALRQRERVEVRYAVQHPELGRRWLLTRVAPSRLGDDRQVFTVVTLDVTDDESTRRRSDLLLQELGTILEISPAGIAYLHGQTVVRCNASFEALLGVPPGECAGLSLEALLARCGVTGAAGRQAQALLRDSGGHDLEFQPEHAPTRRYALALRRSGPTEGGQGADTVAVLSDVTGPRAQQEAQAAREDLARERELMFSLSDVGIIHQVEGRIARTNPAMAELTGMSLEELQGLPVSELYEDERVYLEHRAQERREMADTGRARGERRIRRRDGTPEGELIHVMVSHRPVDDSDHALGTISSFVSVDERRKARESLLRQAEQTRAILDSVLVGIVTVGEGGIIWMNRSARRMFGGELADFMHQPISVVASDEPDHPLRSDWLHTLGEGQAAMFECRLVARDHRAFWVVGNVVATGHDLGEAQLTFALLDIERRRQAETQIAQARASLQRMIETAPLAIALFEAGTQRVLQLNQKMAEFARRPLDDIEGRQPAFWLPSPEAALLSTDLHSARASQEPVHRELRREPASPGAAASVWDMRIVSLVDAAGAGEQLLLVASDVTEQRAADQARLEAAISQREMLVKEVHHRIKNNLQGVAGLLQQNAHRHPEAAAAIAEAVGHVHAIAQVHGLQVGATGPMRVQGVVEAIATSVQRMFGRTIVFSTQGPAPGRFALSEADSIPVALTINELLTNAIKHSTGGDIACELRVSDSDVVVAVRNQGQLKPGFALHAVPSGISGLGLVRALLPRKGASIALDSMALDGIAPDGTGLASGGEQVVATLRLLAPAVTVVAEAAPNPPQNAAQNVAQNMPPHVPPTAPVG